MSALFMANIGAWGSLGFYNAFLPEIAPTEEQDLLSAKGFSWGFAGSVLLLLLCLALIMGIGDHLTRWAFIAVGIWWAGWSQITFRRLPIQIKERPEGNLLWQGFKELRGRTDTQRKDAHHPLFTELFCDEHGRSNHHAHGEFFWHQRSQTGHRRTDHRHHPGASHRHPRAFLFSWMCQSIGNVKVLLVATCLWTGRVPVCLLPCRRILHVLHRGRHHWIHDGWNPERKPVYLCQNAARYRGHHIVFQFLRSPREIRRGNRHVQLGLHRRLYRQHEKLASGPHRVFCGGPDSVGLHSETRALA